MEFTVTFIGKYCLYICNLKFLQRKDNEMKKVVELVLFKVSNGVELEEFMKASAKFEKGFLADQKGLISRYLISDGAGGWGDMAIWDSMEAAQAVGAAMQESECARMYNSFIDPSSIDMKHFTIEN